jgi:hypothetical protein
MHIRMLDRMPSISIACGSPTLPSHFVLASLVRHWEARGHRAAIGPAFLDDADVHVLHVNRTFMTDEYLPPTATSGRTVNWNVRDISKKAITSLRIGPDDDWDGPVIVKTNLNHFGIPESLGKTLTRAQANRERMAHLSWRSARRLPARQYPVLKTLRHVPSWVWSDDSLIVERFMPERDGDLYCLRGWMFFGSRSYGWRLRATDPLVKAGSRVDHSYLTDFPDELMDLRRRLGFDFGKFDYVVHDGRAIVLDVNKTPSFVGDLSSPRLIDLSHGIEDFL